MDFKVLADFFLKLEKTASRNEITIILSELLKKSSQDEVDKVCYLSLGRLLPDYKGLEFNMAERLMFKAVAKAFRKEEEGVKDLFKQIGDLGEVVFSLKKNNGNGRLSVNKVYDLLYEIAKEEGQGSVERKINKTADLLFNLDPLSAKYVSRIPLGRLRLGFSELTILDALSWMLKEDKSQRKFIESVYNVRADIGQIAKIIKDKGSKGLKDLKVQLGVPVISALCQRLPNAEEMIKKMGKVAVEPKYDGTRLQVHKKGQEVNMFTRNLENVTEMFPDINKGIREEIKTKSVILDGEAIGFDYKTGKFLPFQETIKRKRKYGVDEKTKEIPLKYFVFDILYKDGKDLLNLPFNKRREMLEKLVKNDNKVVCLSPQIVTQSPDELKKFHKEQIEKGLEGVVIKKWEAPYDSGRRGYTWVKFKQEKGKKGGGLADTLDCVVMGYYKGKGRRASFGIGGFLVGVKEKQTNDQILTVSKIGTGLSDDQWREMRKRCDEVKIGGKPKQYKIDKNLNPDLWCLPKIVVEIEADNITKSPIHTAGLALRFPRLVRFRDDKSSSQTSNLKEVQKLFDLQK